jgi:hypothetical protein
MNLKKTLSALVTVITDEAAKNDDFKVSLERALGVGTIATSAGQVQVSVKKKTRRGGRRTPAVLDPVELARRGEGVLRPEISKLDLEQLRDIVAQYGMDPGKLVMKWKDSKRVIDKIVELATARATKGDAFRGD